MGDQRQPQGWSSGGASDQGLARTSNQDAYLDRPDLGLWAVADGMGGHHDGGLASRKLVEGLGALNRPPGLAVGAEWVRGLLRTVNQGLIDEAGAKRSDVIGSTIVTLIAVEGQCAILWVGDSRAYRLRAGLLHRLTRDHTIVQDLLTQGFLSPDQAQRHPYASVLSRAIGVRPDLEIDTQLEVLHPGDRYLLCSDGLDKELNDEEIARLLAEADPGTTAARLVQRACDAGGRDNVTAVVIDFHGGGSAADCGESGPVPP